LTALQSLETFRRGVTLFFQLKQISSARERKGFANMNVAVSEGRTRSVPLKAAAPKTKPPKKAPPRKEPAKAALDDREQQDLRLLREHTAALNRIDGELALVQQDVKREEAAKLRAELRELEKPKGPPAPYHLEAGRPAPDGPAGTWRSR